MAVSKCGKLVVQTNMSVPQCKSSFGDCGPSCCIIFMHVLSLAATAHIMQNHENSGTPNMRLRILLYFLSVMTSWW